MNGRTFLKRAGVGAVGAMAMIAGSSGIRAAEGDIARRPNVVLVLTNDQGFGDLGCHGNPHIRTPHMDSFARTAVEFTQFYVSPVCSPTRASLLTGRYNFRTGFCGVFGKGCQMDPGEVTVAEALRMAGSSPITGRVQAR